LFALPLVEDVVLDVILTDRLFWASKVKGHAMDVEDLKPKGIELL
jgi:hypothetical protein